jgi:anti-anti-sigma regulatory factor
MFTREQGMGCEAVVRFNGVLDATSAAEVGPFLQVEPSGTLTLDFSQATDVDSYGLSALVAVIARSDGVVHLRGLRTNQIRMLKYMGLDLDRLGLASDAA